MLDLNKPEYIMNPILNACKELKDKIDLEGETHETTKELVDVTLHIHTAWFDHFANKHRSVYLDEVEDGVVDYYGKYYRRKYRDEEYHYKQLEYSLLHKVKELAYFFKAPLENRKTVVFSNDCISLAQYIKRGNKTKLIVYMRSSDVVSLLPMDLMALAKILRRMNTEYIKPEEGPVEEELVVHIGSAHYYMSGGRE